MTSLSPVLREVKYYLRYTYYSCYDDGGIGHDTSFHTSDHLLNNQHGEISWAHEDEADKMALWALEIDRLAIAKGKQCHDHPGPQRVVGVVINIHEETEDGFKRDSDKLIRKAHTKQCVCGKLYVPLCGEKACHKIVEDT